MWRLEPPIPFGEDSARLGCHQIGWVFNKRAFLNTSENTRLSALRRCSIIVFNNCVNPFVNTASAIRDSLSRADVPDND